MVSLPGTALCGYPSQPSIEDYVHTSWTQHDGVPLSEVSAVTQTTGGYLWIATAHELLRFDGVRFLPFATPCKPRVTALDSDRAGGLWMRCGGKLLHLDASGKVRDSGVNLDFKFPRETTLFVTKDRKVWYWGTALTYLLPDGSSGPAIPGTERPHDAVSCSFAEDREGALWFGSAMGLMRIRDGQVEFKLAGHFRNVTAAGSGGVYAVQDNLHLLFYVRGNAIFHVADFGKNVIAGPGGSVLREVGGNVWFGTRSDGLAFIRNSQIQFFSKEQGLSAATVLTVQVDREGSVWVGTAAGLHRFREPLARLVTSAEGLPSGILLTVFHDSRNQLWMSSSKSTVRIDEFSKAHQIPASAVAIGEELSGRIWLATRTELGYVRGGRFVGVPDIHGAPISGIYSIQRGEQGMLMALSGTGLYRIVNSRPELITPVRSTNRFLSSSRLGTWIGLRDGGLRRIFHGTETVFGKEAGIEEVAGFKEDGGSLWIATEKGLSRWRNGKWTNWTVAHGLDGSGKVLEVTNDRMGRLWLMGEDGILMLSRRQLDETPDGHPRRLEFLRIGTLDRIVPKPVGYSFFFPRVTESRDGRLFFVTFDAIAVVDPSRINEQSFMPPIILESVLVNRRPITPGADSRFVEPDDIQFEYTSLSLRSPENARFRYRLEGRDKDWIDAGSERRVTYGGLKPGSYRFRVIGSGSEGVWNTIGASYDFRIASPFYKTPQFLVAIALTIGTFLFMFYRYRIQLVTERLRLREQAQSDERLRIAQEMHDSLLQELHSVSLTVYAAKVNIDRIPSESHQLLDRAMSILEGSLEHARRMLSSLRSVTEVREPLQARLEGLAAREAAFYPGAPGVSIDVDGLAVDLRDDIDNEVYLIASEALKNALRHAQAKHIRISIQFGPARFQVTVSDDGVGIPPAVRTSGIAGHFGLRGMRERVERHAGEFNIECPETGGTRLRFSFTGSRAYRH